MRQPLGEDGRGDPTYTNDSMWTTHHGGGSHEHIFPLTGRFAHTHEVNAHLTGTTSSYATKQLPYGARDVSRRGAWVNQLERDFDEWMRDEHAREAVLFALTTMEEIFAEVEAHLTEGRVMLRSQEAQRNRCGCHYHKMREREGLY